MQGLRRSQVACPRSHSQYVAEPGSRCSVQFSSVAQSCLTLCDPVDCSMPGFPVYHQLPELAQTHVHRVGDAIQPLLLLPSIFPRIRVFSKESVLCIRWLKYWSFSISPSNKYSGLISFRIDWFDLLSVQGTLKSLLQHHSSKASILGHSAFFILQLSHPFPWRRKWQPTQCSSLENPMDRGAWWATVHGVSKESDKTE